MPLQALTSRKPLQEQPIDAPETMSQGHEAPNPPIRPRLEASLAQATAHWLQRSAMEQGQLNWIANFIWGIADDVLRDLYVRGKYRDVILPMTVLRRLDAVLEPTKQAVLEMKASLDAAQIVHQDPALRQGAGQAFYNTSKFTLRDLVRVPCSGVNPLASAPA